VGRTKSTAHISGKSQILYLLVYMTRFLDLFPHFISVYNSVFQGLYILLSTASVTVIYYNIRNSRTLQADSFRMEILVIPSFLLALLLSDHRGKSPWGLNHKFSVLEILWRFSIYLEALAMIPQMFLVRKTGGSRGLNKFYLPLMGVYRFLYILNWIYRYKYESFYDVLAIGGGVVQTLVYVAFLAQMWCSPVKVYTCIDFQEITQDVFELEERLLLDDED